MGASIWTPGSTLIAAAFSHAVDYAAGTVGDRLSREVFITDAPYSAPTDGTTSAVSVINTCDALDQLVIYPAGLYLIDSDITLDGGPHLFLLGAKWIINPGVKVTIKTQIIAGNHQIFQDGNVAAAGYPIYANLKGLRFFPGGSQTEVLAAWWGAKGDYILPNGNVNGSATDNTQPFKQAINAVYDQYELNGDPTLLYRRSASVVVGNGNFKTLAEVNVTACVLFRGQGKNNTMIHGVHTGNAVLSAQSAFYMLFRDLQVVGDSTHTPKTGFMFGRDSSGSSAGVNTMMSCKTTGKFSVGPVENVASEEFNMIDCEINVEGGGAHACFINGQSDPYGTGLTAAANTVIRLLNSSFSHFNPDPAVNTSVLEFYSGSISDDIIVSNCFLGARGTNQFVRLAVIQDVNDAGKYIFDNIHGEDDNDVTKLTNGFVITRGASQALTGLRISGTLTSTHPSALFLACNDTEIRNLHLRTDAGVAKPIKLGYLLNPDIMHCGDLDSIQLMNGGFLTYRGSKTILPLLRDTNVFTNAFINDGVAYCGNTGIYEQVGGTTTRIVSEGQNKVVYAPTGTKPTYMHAEIGDRIKYTDAVAGAVPGLYCITAGQTTVAAGTTGNVATGSPTAVVVSAANLQVDFLVTIAGSAINPFRITKIVGTTLTLNKNSDVTDVAAAVAGVTAVWRNEAAIA